MLEITDADREAAASVAVLSEMRELILSGRADHHAEPFARHRLAEREAVEAECNRYRAALTAIQQAVVEGRVCDDVAWFSHIETLFDFIEEVLRPSQPAAIGDLFEAGEPFK